MWRLLVLRNAAEEINMTSGGSRNRSGPSADPKSGRSERRGLKLSTLPSEGWNGTPPSFMLPNPSQRERELWKWAWCTPQAAAWNREPWRWHAVAMWVRTAVTCESQEASAAERNSLHRFADQIGLTPAGLRENGWRIAEDELAERRAPVAEPEVESDDPRSRMRVVNGGA